jgi:hypothetical protein
MESSTLLSCLQSDIREMALKVFQSVFYKRKCIIIKAAQKIFIICTCLLLSCGALLIPQLTLLSVNKL